MVLKTRDGYTLTQHTPYTWEFKTKRMHVPARVYADEQLIKPLAEPTHPEWSALRQLENVASLPGIVQHALAMADVHPGYGFPIGGVAAFDAEEGMIIVGGVGFDINCGVRIMRTPLTLHDMEKKKEELADTLFTLIPAGLGKPGFLRLSMNEMDEVLEKGAEYIVKNLGYTSRQDLSYIEENGRITGADPATVSRKAKQRGLSQMGTLGSGNHYLEVQYVDEVYDETAARAYGLEKDQIVISMHCGSRGLGHQVGTDYLSIMRKAVKKYGLSVPDEELVGAPVQSEEGQQYLAAVRAASNAAFANRQLLAHFTREALSRVFSLTEKDVTTVYEVAHNTAKEEVHHVHDERRRLIVHRKGATRAFTAGMPGIPEPYERFGHPMPVGGTMGTASFILRGTQRAAEKTFASGIHGAGRAESRGEAKRKYAYETVIKQLAERGIIVRSMSKSGITEEAPGAYKDVERVVNIMHEAGINRKVARLRPIIVVKG